MRISKPSSSPANPCSRVPYSCIERWNPRLAFAAEGTGDHPTALTTAEDLDGACRWIDKPQPGHALVAIDVLLAGPIDEGRGGRENLAHPVGRQGEVGHVGTGGHALATPASQVWHQNLRVQVKLGLKENDPAAWAAASPVKRTRQLPPERRGGQGVA